MMCTDLITPQMWLFDWSITDWIILPFQWSSTIMQTKDGWSGETWFRCYGHKQSDVHCISLWHCLGWLLVSWLITGCSPHSARCPPSQCCFCLSQQKNIMAERNVLLKSLKHPFLVGLHYSFQTPEKLYFVLDYVNGGEVQPRVKTGAWIDVWIAVQDCVPHQFKFKAWLLDFRD